MLKRLALASPLILPLLVIIGIVVAFVTLSGIRELVPPKTLSVAVGRPGSGYWQIAERYKAILARDGITLEMVETPGSLINARLLGDGEVDTALLQGGVPVVQSRGLEALAGIFLEPVFIFYRAGTAGAADLAAWDRLRIAAGEPGSGTRVAVSSMVQALAVRIDQERFAPLGGADAVAALQSGAVDVAVFVAPVSAPYLQPLFRDPGVRIASLRDSEALSRRLSYVLSADIPPAALDYSRRLPPERVELTAVIASLAARGDLHPALVNRLVRAAQQIHSGPSLVSKDMVFPTTQGLDLPINKQAGGTLESRPGVLENALPYWVAAQITRVTILLVPLLVLLVPLVRLVPGIYAWQMRARVYRRYSELVGIDIESEDALTDARRAALLDQLDLIDQDAKAVAVPVKYREYVYTLRMHIDLVRRKLLEADRA
jgi:TRAP-type uncharacterized transport system substrate-binding protein